MSPFFCALNIQSWGIFEYNSTTDLDGKRWRKDLSKRFYCLALTVNKNRYSLFTSQTKYVYYLLSISASCIAFSLYQTKGAPLSFSQIPLGITMCLWGASFYFGCKKLTSNLTIKSKNFFMVQNAYHSFEKEKAKGEMDAEIVIGGKYFKYQFNCLIAGTFGFVIWHIWEMAKLS